MLALYINMIIKCLLKMLQNYRDTQNYLRGEIIEN